jgi:predicted lipoprotein
MSSCGIHSPHFNGPACQQSKANHLAMQHSAAVLAGFASPGTQELAKARGQVVACHVGHCRTVGRGEVDVAQGGSEAAGLAW